MRHRPRGKRKPWIPPADALTINIQGSGNATIVAWSGEVVGVLEDWRLWVNGQDVGEVSNYHEAVERTRKVLTA